MERSIPFLSFDFVGDLVEAAHYPTEFLNSFESLGALLSKVESGLSINASSEPIHSRTLTVQWHAAGDQANDDTGSARDPTNRTKHQQKYASSMNSITAI